MKTILALLMLSQVADPIPDRIKLQFATAHRDMLKAAEDKRAAMMAYNAAELRYEGAKHRMAEAEAIATASCAPKAFDSEKMACADR